MEWLMIITMVCSIASDEAQINSYTHLDAVVCREQILHCIKTTKHNPVLNLDVDRVRLETLIPCIQKPRKRFRKLNAQP